MGLGDPKPELEVRYGNSAAGDYGSVISPFGQVHGTRQSKFDYLRIRLNYEIGSSLKYFIVGSSIVA